MQNDRTYGFQINVKVIITLEILWKTDAVRRYDWTTARSALQQRKIILPWAISTKSLEIPRWASY